MANLVTEIESLMKVGTAHCSDIFTARREERLFHSTKTGLRRLSHTGEAQIFQLRMAYPGTNNDGVYSTQNTLFPQPTRGLSTLAQRIANCGPIGKAFNIVDNIDEFSTLLHTKNWAASASLNVVDLNHQKMANIEVYEDGYSRYNVQENYSHFNMFKHLKIGIEHDEGDNSTRHRQKRVKAATSFHDRRYQEYFLRKTKCTLSLIFVYTKYINYIFFLK